MILVRIYFLRNVLNINTQITAKLHHHCSTGCLFYPSEACVNHVTGHETYGPNHSYKVPGG
jgi:hypothetical protein